MRLNTRPHLENNIPFGSFQSSEGWRHALTPLDATPVYTLFSTWFTRYAVVVLVPTPKTVPNWKSCCWFIKSCVFLLITQTRFMIDIPLGSTVAFTTSTCLIHPRPLRACAEPRPAPARRGEAPLVSRERYKFRDTRTAVFVEVLPIGFERRFGKWKYLFVVGNATQLL